VTLPNQKPLDELIVLGGAVLGLEQPKEKVDEDGQGDREDKWDEEAARRTPIDLHPPASVGAPSEQQGPRLGVWAKRVCALLDKSTHATSAILRRHETLDHRPRLRPQLELNDGGVADSRQHFERLVAKLKVDREEPHLALSSRT
jgi:hypothetical protein